MVASFNNKHRFPTFFLKWGILSSNIVPRYFQIPVIRWDFEIKISFREAENIKFINRNSCQ